MTLQSNMVRRKIKIPEPILKVTKLAPKRGIDDDFNFGIAGSGSVITKEDPIKNIKIFQNVLNIKIIKQTLTSAFPVLIVEGPSSSGKITLIKKCLYEMSYINKEFNDEVESSDVIIKSFVLKGIENFLGISGLRAIIIKNFDNILNKIQQQEVLEYLSVYKKNLDISILNPGPGKKSIQKIVPIFITTNSKRFLIKYIRTIVIEPPTINDLIKFGLEKLNVYNSANKTEKIILEKDFRKMALLCNGDLRQFDNLFIMAMSNIPSSQNPVKDKLVVETGLKDLDFDLIEKLKYISSKEILSNKIVQSNIHTNAVVHENYGRFIQKHQQNPDQMMDLSRIADIISDTDIIYSHISEKQLWDDIDCLYMYYTLGSVYPLKIVADNGEKTFFKNEKKYKKDEEFSYITDIKFSPNINSHTDCTFESLDQIIYTFKYIFTNELQFLKRNLKFKKDEEILNFKETVVKLNLTDIQIRLICKNIDITVPVFKRFFYE